MKTSTFALATISPQWQQPQYAPQHWQPSAPHWQQHPHHYPQCQPQALHWQQPPNQLPQWQQLYLQRQPWYVQKRRRQQTIRCEDDDCKHPGCFHGRSGRSEVKRVKNLDGQVKADEKPEQLMEQTGDSLEEAATIVMSNEKLVELLKKETFKRSFQQFIRMNVLFS